MSLGPRRPTFKPTPYGYTRRSRGIPRWLLLLITGIVLGAGGVLFLQRSYGPQRLTVEQSEQLRMDLNTANVENQRLATESKKLRETLTQTEQKQQAQSREVTQLRKRYDDMQSSIAGLIEAIPPDPRGTSPGIRAADMTVSDAGLNYQVLLIQDLPKGQTDVPTLRGEIKLIAIGTYSNGKTGYLDMDTQSLDMGRFAVFNGTWTGAPKGFRPRQVTVQVTGEGSDKVIATRTIHVTTKR